MNKCMHGKMLKVYCSNQNFFPLFSFCASTPAEDEQAVRMKEENLFHRRFSLCPNATSPPKIDPRTLTRNLSYGGDNDLYNLSPGKRPRGQSWQVKGQNLIFQGNVSVDSTVCEMLVCCTVLIPYKYSASSYKLLLGLPCFNCLSAGLFTEFICMWLCVVGSHQAVRQTGTVSPCWVMNLVLPNHQAAR